MLHFRPIIGTRAWNADPSCPRRGAERRVRPQRSLKTSRERILEKRTKTTSERAFSPPRGFSASVAPLKAPRSPFLGAQQKFQRPQQRSSRPLYGLPRPPEPAFARASCEASAHQRGWERKGKGAPPVAVASPGNIERSHREDEAQEAAAQDEAEVEEVIGEEEEAAAESHFLLERMKTKTLSLLAGRPTRSPRASPSVRTQPRQAPSRTKPAAPAEPQASRTAPCASCAGRPLQRRGGCARGPSCWKRRQRATAKAKATWLFLVHHRSPHLLAGACGACERRGATAARPGLLRGSRA